MHSEYQHISAGLEHSPMKFNFLEKGHGGEKGRLQS